MKSAGRIPALVVAAWLSSTCASEPPPAPPRAEAPPATGEALIRYRHGLERARSALLALQDSVDVIHARPDLSDRELIADFTLAYLAMHVDPLLAPDWTSASPPLEVLDAELRLLEAELLMRLERRPEAGRVLDEIERRFAHRSSLVVDYPVGKPSPLAEAVRLVRAPRWWSL